MPTLVFNALFSSVFVVRIVKGRWTRHPHYLAIATLASLLALMVLNAWQPGAADSFIYGNLAAIVGGWLGLLVYDRTVGAL